MKYTPHWDLTTIPDSEFRSEHGRRNRAKAPKATNVKLKPCAKCGTPLTATQRRKPCSKCGYVHPRKAAS